MPKPLDEQDDPQSLAANLYKQNVEILGKNTTLSLLRELYEISILALDTAELASKVSEAVRTQLTLESVSVLLYQEKEKSFKMLASSYSERLGGLMKQLKLKESDFSSDTNKFLEPLLTTKDK